MKYRFRRKEKLLTFGAWPELGLGEARARRDQAREQLRYGRDPAGAAAPIGSHRARGPIVAPGRRRPALRA